MGHVKLSDFGISKELDSTTALSNTSVGSNPYMSPERLEGDRYDASSDVWAVGISIIELWQKKYPFASIRGSPIDLCGEIKRFRYDEWMPATSFPTSMRRCIQSMLLPNPEERATSYELTTAPWLEECRILSLDDAQQSVHSWLFSTRHSTSDAKASHEFGRAPVRGISAALARDMCEMSISLDASKNSWTGGVGTSGTDDMNISRTMNNPFMSSGNLMSSGTGFSMNHHAGAVPKGFKDHTTFAMKEDDEEYEEDFEEDVEPMHVEMKYDSKRSSGSYRK